jgi:hypothetical protein
MRLTFSSKKFSLFLQKQGIRFSFVIGGPNAIPQAIKLLKLRRFLPGLALIYPKHFKNWHFGGAKTPKFDDRKLPHIVNT